MAVGKWGGDGFVEWRLILDRTTCPVGPWITPGPVRQARLAKVERVKIGLVPILGDLDCRQRSLPAEELQGLRST